MTAAHPRRLLPLLLLLTLLSPSLAAANPLLGMQGTILLRDHGQPYRQPIRLTMTCPSYLKTYTYTKTCLGDQCPIGWLAGQIFWWYSDGPCHLTLQPVAGPTLTFPGFIPGDLGGQDTMRFLVEVDIGTRQVHPVDLPQRRTLLSSYTTLFCLALLLTMVLEAGALLLLTEYWLKLTHLGIKAVLLAGALPSLYTLPCVWFLLPKLWGALGYGYLPYILAAEALVVVVEAHLYRRRLPIGLKPSLLLSLVANTLSFLAGLLLF